MSKKEMKLKILYTVEMKCWTNKNGYTNSTEIEDHIHIPAWFQQWEFYYIIIPSTLTVN